MEKWNELCYILSDSLPANANEQLFELKVIQAFEKLGWSQYRNEIIVRESIQVGASNRVSPDLVFKSSEMLNLFIVEVKNPQVYIEMPTYRGQLSSYMGLMRVEVGILIGKKIQLYLDGRHFNKNGIVLIEELDFIRDSDKGLKFVELFSKDFYDIQKIEEYAKRKILELKELQDIRNLKIKLLSNEYNFKIIDCLKNILQNEYEISVIEKVFEDIKINVSDKTIKPSTLKNEKNEKINNSRVGVGKDPNTLPIGKYVQKTFGELITDNIIDSEEVERLQSPEYSKVTFDIQYPFLAKEDSRFYERVRYWKKPFIINGELFYATSQWYEVDTNNDRPYYEAWLEKMKRS